MRAWGASITRWGLLTGLYFAGTVLASLYLKTPQDVTLFWPSSGIAYALVVRYGLRAALVIPVGILLLHALVVPVPPLFVPFSVGSNLFGALAAGIYVRRKHPQPWRLVSADGLLLLRGGLLLGAVSTAIGCTGLEVAGMIPMRQTSEAAMLWFLGDLLGVTSTMPGLMLLFAHYDDAGPMLRTRNPAQRSEHVAWVIALCISLSLVFATGRSGSPYALALVSLPLAVLMWSAVRFNPLWTTIATFATVVFLSLTTGLGLGSFIRPPTPTDAALLILMLCLISILPLLLAASDHEKRMAGAALYKRATRDPITGLLNRATFAERARQRLATTDGDLTLLFLDLDQFKLVNSSGSHAAGDELLRNIGNLVQAEAGEDALVARVGGDEYALLVRAGDAASRVLARRLITGIEALRPAWNGNMLAITTSIGMVPSQPPHADFDTMLSLASAACAAAKEHGGGRFRIALPDSDESRLRTEVMRSALRVRAAIDERRFVPYCQSIVPLHENLDHGRHFEVLLRLIDPDGKVLPPAEFIAAAASRPIGCVSRSPKPASPAIAPAPSASSAACANSAAISRWTISAPASARSATCATSMSISSRSTAASCARWNHRRWPAPWCARSPTSRTCWTSAPSPSRSRMRASARRSRWSAWITCRATRSTARCRSTTISRRLRAGSRARRRAAPKR
jgi:diguanylate cyclase (GGDEF)-like protein